EFVLHPQEVGGTTEVVEYAGPLVPGGDDGRRRTEHLVDLPQPQSSVGHLPQDLQPGDVPPGQGLLAAQRPSCVHVEHRQRGVPTQRFVQGVEEFLSMSLWRQASRERHAGQVAHLTAGRNVDQLAVLVVGERTLSRSRPEVVPVHKPGLWVNFVVARLGNVLPVERLPHALHEGVEFLIGEGDLLQLRELVVQLVDLGNDRLVGQRFVLGGGYRLVNLSPNQVWIVGCTRRHVVQLPLDEPLKSSAALGGGARVTGPSVEHTDDHLLAGVLQLVDNLLQQTGTTQIGANPDRAASPVEVAQAGSDLAVLVHKQELPTPTVHGGLRPQVEVTDSPHAVGLGGAENEAAGDVGFVGWDELSWEALVGVATEVIQHPHLFAHGPEVAVPEVEVLALVDLLPAG